MTINTCRWRADEYPKSVDRLNKAVNGFREDAVRMSLVLVEDGAYNQYESMATSKTTEKEPLNGKGASGSLEDIHNNYHDIIGGDPKRETEYKAGHMSSVPTAAFDPIFWAHHW
jgi:hypothetical protein